MKSDRVLIEDVLSSHNRKDAISKMEKYLENVRLNTAEKIYEYIHNHISNGGNLNCFSIRSMLENVFTESIK